MKPLASKGEEVGVSFLLGVPRGDAGYQDRFSVTAWEKVGDTVRSLGDGARVQVTGHLRRRSWQAQDGSTRYETQVVASDVAAIM